MVLFPGVLFSQIYSPHEVSENKNLSYITTDTVVFFNKNTNILDIYQISTKKNYLLILIKFFFLQKKKRKRRKTIIQFKPGEELKVLTLTQ